MSRERAKRPLIPISTEATGVVMAAYKWGDIYKGVSPFLRAQRKLELVGPYQKIFHFIFETVSIFGFLQLYFATLLVFHR